MLKFEKDMFHKHNGIKSLTDNEVHEIQHVYWEAEQKIICPFCYMTRKRLVEKSTYLDLPNKEYGFVLYRELIRNNFLVENLSLEKVHRCPKCNRRLD